MVDRSRRVSFQAAISRAVALTVGVTIVGFHRSGIDAFDLFKFTLLVGAAGVFVGPVLANSPSDRYRVLRGSQMSVIGLILVPIIVSVLAHGSFSAALFGQYQRYNGALLGIAALVMALGGASFKKPDIEFSIAILLFSAFVNASYSVLQFWNRDPFEWTTNSFGPLITGTMGNPNTAAGIGAFLAPIAVAYSFASKGVVRRVLSSLVGAMILAASQVFNSAVAFSVALGVALVLLVACAKDPRVQTRWRCLLWTTCVGVSLTLRPSIAVWVGLIFGATSAIQLPRGLGARVVSRSTDRKLLLALGLASVPFVPMIWRMIDASLRDGLSERRGFYGAALKIFWDHPLFGTGLDSFGSFFHEYRSRGATFQFENSLSSSVHNYYLGWLANGGIVLFVPLLVFVVMLVWSAFGNALRRRDDWHIDLGLAGAVITFVVQMLVQVEHVALIAAAALVAGLVLARRDEPRPTARGRSTRNGLKVLMIASVVSGLFLAFVVVNRPLRADHSFREALVANSRNDLVASKRELENANRFAPWEPVYAAQLAQVAYQVGDLDQAGRLAWSVARAVNFDPVNSPPMAVVLFSVGRTSDAYTVLSLALAKNQYARSLANSVLDLSEQAVDAFIASGDRASASTWAELKRRAQQRVQELNN